MSSQSRAHAQQELALPPRRSDAAEPAPGVPHHVAALPPSPPAVGMQHSTELGRHARWLHGRRTRRRQTRRLTRERTRAAFHTTASPEDGVSAHRRPCLCFIGRTCDRLMAAATTSVRGVVSVVAWEAMSSGIWSGSAWLQADGTTIARAHSERKRAHAWTHELTRPHSCTHAHMHADRHVHIRSGSARDLLQPNAFIYDSTRTGGLCPV